MPQRPKTLHLRRSLHGPRSFLVVLQQPAAPSEPGRAEPSQATSAILRSVPAVINVLAHHRKSEVGSRGTTAETTLGGLRDPGTLRGRDGCRRFRGFPK